MFVRQHRLSACAEGTPRNYAINCHAVRSLSAVLAFGLPAGLSDWRPIAKNESSPRGSRTQPMKTSQASRVDRTIRSHANLSRASFAQTANALDREWLVTNGVGGFACASVALANPRRYHGVLVVALKPPVQRVLM